MAHMYPPDGPAADLQSRAEGSLYQVLKRQLGSDYHIVHSTKWHAQGDDGRVQDGEADFVVIHPQQGILVLEVKGGGVQVHGLRRRWYTLTAAGKQQAIANPFDQAMKSMHVLLRTVRRAPTTRQYAHDYRLGYAVWFPDIVWLPGQVGWLQSYDALILDERDMQMPEAGLRRIYEHFARVPRSPALFPPQELSPAAIRAVIDLLNPSFAIHPHTKPDPDPNLDFNLDPDPLPSLPPLLAAPSPPARPAPAVPDVVHSIQSIQLEQALPVVVPAPSATFSPLPLLPPTPSNSVPLRVQFAREGRAFDALTRDQYDHLLAVRQHPRLAIPGAAGTGKTVLALESAWRFAHEGLHVVLLCPTPELADRIRGQVATEPNTGRLPFDVYDIKSLCAALARRMGARSDAVSALRMDRQDDQKTLSSLLKASIDRLRRRDALTLYDAILVDDAHDLNQALWVPIQKLLRDPPSGLLYAFYDLRQRVDFEERWRLAIGGATITRELTENLRNTQAIYETMRQYQPDLASCSFAGREGRAVTYIDAAHGQRATAIDTENSGDDVDDGDAALLSVLDWLIDGEQIPPHEIAIITCRGRERSRWDRSAARTLGTGKYTLRWLSDGEREGSVVLTTMRSCKGLEWSVVILAELDGLNTLVKKRKAWLYIATSRAKHHLVVVGPPQDLAP